MDPDRRRFLRTTGLAGLATTSAGLHSAPSAADTSVKRVAGPFGDGLPLTVAGYDYNRVRALTDGRATIEGCSLTYEVSSIGPMNNHAFFGSQSRHVTEIGLVPFILAFANDEFRDYMLLPIPVLRMFRQKSIWVRKDSGIDTPSDLRGRRVATVGYSSSGLTHVRGLLQDEFGVKPSEIKWVATRKDSAVGITGGVSKWEQVRPSGVEIIDAPPGEDDSTLLLSGEVDAIFHPAEPRVYQERHPSIRRLFADHRSVEQDYFKRTGIFPIMHAVAIRRDTANEHPWLIGALFKAYSQAKAIDVSYMQKLGWAYDSLPWYGQEFNETRSVMGENFYPYGYQASARAFDTAFRYVHEQGLSQRQITLEEVFEPATRELAEVN